MHNKNLGIIEMSQDKKLDRLAPEKYGSQKAKSADMQGLNTRPFYDLIRKNRIPATILFA